MGWTLQRSSLSNSRGYGSAADQGSAVLLQRYADPGCATVYKVTENALSELLGRAPNLYVPPRTQFLTEKGDVVDAPLIKAPGKAGGPHRK